MFPFLFSVPTSSLTVAIIGSHGDLGRELVYQTLSRPSWYCLAGTRHPEKSIIVPYRDGWKKSFEIKDERLVVASPEELQSFYSFDALLFAHSSKSKEDSTDTVVRQLCINLPSSCKKVGLVSYTGMDKVREALPTHSWLRERYVSKWNQEMALENLVECEVRIWRETCLSHGSVSCVTTPRQSLAAHMLEWVGSEADGELVS